VRAPKPVGCMEYVDCADLIGEMELLGCLKTEKLQDTVQAQLANKDPNHKFPPFPDQNTVLKKLKELELLCHFEEMEDGIFHWIVNYDEAAVAIGTKVLETKLIINPNKLDLEKKRIHDWFIEFFSAADNNFTATRN